VPLEIDDAELLGAARASRLPSCELPSRMASASASNAGAPGDRSSRADPKRADRDPVQLRHAHAVELAREDVVLNVIQRQLGHATLGTTSI
jgi:integrase